MKIIVLLTALSALVSAGIIHSQLAEKLAGLENNEPVQVIVYMKDQVDLSIIPRAVKAEKIAYLQQYARDDQADLLSYFDGFENEVTNLKTWWIFNGLTFCAARDIIEKVAARGDVDYVIDNAIIHMEKDFEIEEEDRAPGVSWAIKRTDTDDCWDDGYDGSGIIVGNIDGGVDVNHPALHGRWIPGGWYDAVNDSTHPYDDYGHGTATMGIMCGGDGLGPDQYDVGVAPGAHFICAKVFDANGNTSLAWLHNGMQWFATQDADVCLGEWCSSRTMTDYWVDCENLRSLGFHLVFPLYNSGPAPMTDRTPANYPIVTGVGATDHFDNIAGWSSRGPAPNQTPWNDTTYWERPDWNLIKPDISAPGAGIPLPITSYLGGGYAYGCGTSFSSPVVAGAVAILLQRDSTLSHHQVYNILLNTADRPVQGAPYPNNNYGWGRLNVYSALYAIPGWSEPNVVLRKANVINDNNMNGKLDPGETAEMVGIVKNIGASSATNLQGILRTASSYITITDSLFNFGTVSAGDSANNLSNPFNVAVDSTAPVGTMADFQLALVSAETTWTRTFTKKIGTEPGDLIWGPKDLANITMQYRAITGVAYDWAGNQIFVLNSNDRYVRKYSADSLVTSMGQFYGPAFSPTDLAYSYSDDNLWITSSSNKQIWKITKSGTVLRQFANPANDYPIGLAYHDNTLYCADHRTTNGDTNYIYISDTLGNATRYVNPVQGYRNAQCIAFDTCGNSYVQVHDWFHENYGLIQDSVGIIEYQGEPPTLTGNRFLWPPGWGMKGIEFDPRDGNYWITLEGLNQIMKVKGFYDATVGVAEIKTPIDSRYLVFNIGQNPVVTNLTCKFSILTPGNVNLDIYDIAGRAVYTLIKNRFFDAGSHNVTWNLKDKTSKDVACGIYFLRLQVGDLTEIRKVVKVR